MRSKDTGDDIAKRRSELPPNDAGLPDDAVWKTFTQAFEDSGITGQNEMFTGKYSTGMFSVASEMWTVADVAAEIAIVNGDATVEAVHERAKQLEQQLTERLSAVD